MANTFTKQDVYSIMNGLTAQVLGTNSTLTVVDTETFVTVGETLLRTSAEGTLNAISELCVRTIFSVRPYRRKLDILDVDEFAWGGMVRKLTPLYKELEKSNDNNIIFMKIFKRSIQNFSLRRILKKCEKNSKNIYINV